MRAAAGDGIHNIYKFAMRARRAAYGSRVRPVAEPRPSNIAVAPLISKEGSHIGRLIIFDDVTDRAEMERRLVQADKLSSIGLLAAGVAHEVNTPLAVISTYAQMLAKQIAGDAEKAPLLEKIAQADFPRERDRQFAAEFLAHLDHRVRGRGSEQGAAGDVTLMEHQLAKARIEVESGAGRKACRASRAIPGSCSRCF